MEEAIEHIKGAFRKIQGAGAEYSTLEIDSSTGPQLNGIGDGNQADIVKV